MGPHKFQLVLENVKNKNGKICEKDEEEMNPHIFTEKIQGKSHIFPFPEYVNMLMEGRTLFFAVI